MKCLKTCCSYILGLFIFLWILPVTADNKLLIFTYSYNRPDFIEIQDRTFKKFLLDDYEFVVFNDARDPSLKAQIQQTCARLNIQCFDMPQHLHLNHEPSHRNAAIVNYSLQALGFWHDGVVVLLDSDMFLVKEFSIKEYMGNYPLCGVNQVRASEKKVVDYLWVGIVFLDMKNLPNKNIIDFGLGNVNGVQTDTGGKTHYYLSQNRGVPVRYMNSNYTLDAFKQLKSCLCIDCQIYGRPCVQAIQNINNYGAFDDKQIKFINATGGDNSEFYVDANFFHYRCGSNWDNKSRAYHENKTKCFNAYITSILED